MTIPAKLLIVGFFLISLGLLVFLGLRGIVYSDEGYVLYGAERILNGQVPYKDFHFAYTPLSLYITASAFMILGKSIIVGRILMIGVAITTSIALFYLFKTITKNIYLSLLGIFLYIVWAPLHANFPWPVLFGIPLGILSCYFLLKGEKSQNKKVLLFAGFFAFLVLFTKQNFGVLMLIIYGVALAVMPILRKKDAVFLFLSGFFLPALLYLGYLLLSGSFIPFFQDFYIYTIKRIVIEQTLTTPFLLGETLPEKIAKLLFYTIPLSCGGFALYLSVKREKKYVFLSVFVCLFYLFGIRPTTDYIHLTPLLALTGIPLVIGGELIKMKIVKYGIFLLAIFLIISGLYSALYRGYYKWEPPLIIQNKFLSLPKTYIFLDPFHNDQLQRIHTVISKTTKRSDPIFVNAYIPMLYFLTNRKNPTPYDLVEPTDFYIPHEKNIIDILEKQQVRVVITRSEPGRNYLGEYIKKEYNKSAMINDFIIWKKNKK